MRNPLIPAPKRGRYVSFEGIEGSGKTYYLNELNRRHANKFYPITEFSNEGFGAKIIEVLSHKSDEFFRHGYPVSEALFFFSMKLFEFDKSILPLLREGRLVIEDRSVDTNCLYAAILLQEKYGEKEMYDYYEQLLDIRKELAVIPERTVCFIPDFVKALEKAQRRDGRDYNESELSFLVKIYSGYEEISEKNKDRISNVYPDRYTTNEIISQLESILEFE